MEAVKAYFTKPLINPITMLFLFLLSKIQQCSVGRQGVCFRAPEMVLRDQLPEYAEEFVSFAEKAIACWSLVCTMGFLKNQY
ncbi:hypothetical protein [Enterococcus faecium]|uniref:hypothetical protein n=1 Tax=Enterococcus faecium TaxID=1352 RepID=UPI0021F805D5|nr:hypothetical protein [Enterococcus faecium]